MSCCGSKRTARASSFAPVPRSWTTVSCSPATTCALVTTTPSPATQPEPSTPRPHAVPSTRTRLPAAARTCGSRAIREVGACTSPTPGPPIRGSGSKRASALRMKPDGGRTSLSARRIADRWMSRRSPSPGVCSSTEPAIQTSPSARTAPRAAPRPPSSARTPGSRTADRSAVPATSSAVAQTEPRITAPPSANSGAYGECEPSDSTSGPMRLPRKAPAPNPTSWRAPMMKPWRRPLAASRTAKATMIQSMAVMGSATGWSSPPA